MGLFKHLIQSKDWGIVRGQYGEDITKELRSLPNAEPYSLMNEQEKAALKVILLLDRQYALEDRSITRISKEESQKRREMGRNALKILGEGEQAKRKWQRRLEEFKNNSNSITGKQDVFFTDFKSEIDYDRIAEELRHISDDMAEAGIVPTIKTINNSPVLDFEYISGYFSNLFYLYGAVRVSEIIKYKLDESVINKEIGAMVNCFAEKGKADRREIKSAVYSNNSMEFEGMIRGKLRIMIPVHLDNEDVFEGYFKTIDQCVDEWKNENIK